MQSDNEKVVQFYNAINEYAERQRLNILYETEQQYNSELARAEQEALSDAYRMIQRETADMRAEIAKELSSHEYDGRRALFEQRVALEKKVFEEAAEKLLEFASGSDYDAYLRSAAEAAAKAFARKPSAAVFCIREVDSRFESIISEAYGGECSFRADNSIKLGGIRALNEELGIALDATLDARLEQQHEWFSENAGLSIE